MPKVSKRFDRALFEECDAKCRTRAREILKPTKFAVQDNPNCYSADLMIYKNGIHIGFCELEIKRVWKTKEFGYDTIQFPSRKEKLAKLDKPTLFVMFNHDLSEYLVVKDKELLVSPLVEVPNKYVFSGELFFQVPKNKVSFNNLEEELNKL